MELASKMERTYIQRSYDINFISLITQQSYIGKVFILKLCSLSLVGYTTGNIKQNANE